MLLQEKPNGRFPYGIISVDELLTGLYRCHCHSLASIGQHVMVPRDQTVFAIGDEPKRIFVHCSGRVLVHWKDGMALTIDACPAGENRIYGLVESLSGQAFDIGMTTVTNSEFYVIDRDELFIFLQDQPVLCFRLAEVLSRICQSALQTIKSH